MEREKMERCLEQVMAYRASGYVFTGYANVASRNIEAAVMDALHVARTFISR